MPAAVVAGRQSSLQTPARPAQRHYESTKVVIAQTEVVTVTLGGRVCRCRTNRLRRFVKWGSYLVYSLNNNGLCTMPVGVCIVSICLRCVWDTHPFSFSVSRITVDFSSYCAVHQCSSACSSVGSVPFAAAFALVAFLVYPSTISCL